MNQLCIYFYNEILNIYTFYGQNFSLFNYFYTCLAVVKTP
jgi:hypothetical protein